MEALFCDFLPLWRKISHAVILTPMKTAIIIFLLFTFGCKKDSSTESASEATTQTQSPTSPTNPGGNSAPDATTLTWTEKFMDLVNDHRASIGLRGILIDDGLNDIALKHSRNMASGAVAFGHTGFSGRCSEGYAELGGGNWCAENVAKGQKTPEAAFNSWMNSSGHRANIESTKTTHTGFAYAKSSNGAYYWTQIFIRKN